MPIEKTPYEFLVRFKKDGALSGAHIKFFETISEGGEVLLEREGKAQPVETANEAGFPMLVVLNAIHVGAIAAFDAEIIAHIATKTERDAEIREKEKAQQKLDGEITAHAATLAAKDAEIKACKQEAAASLALFQQQISAASSPK